MSLKEKLVEFSHKVYENKFVAAYDGNLSARTESETILITRSGVCKGNLKIDDIIEIDINGKIISGSGKISTENKIHLFAYEKRKDVNAVIHCHPIYTTAFSLVNESLSEHYFPEVMLTIGKVPVCEFAVPSTEAVPESMSPYIDYSQAMILKNHGVVTLGKSIEDAYFKMEKLEHAAKTLFMAKQLGEPSKISKENVDKIFSIADSVYGIKLDRRNIY